MDMDQPKCNMYCYEHYNKREYDQTLALHSGTTDECILDAA